MRRSLSWIDDDDLGAALERAGVSGHKKRSTHSASPWAENLVAEQPSPAPPSKDLTPFKPPGGSLQTRLKALFVWLMEQTGCRRLFVVDDEGLLLMEKNADPALVAISSSFLTTFDRVQASLDFEAERSLAVDLESGQVLHLVGTETRLGRFALGFVVSSAARRAVVQAVKAGLRETLDEPA